MQNLRLIRFLSIKKVMRNRGGMIFSDDGNHIEGLYDDWGHPFTVILNSNDDEVLRFRLGTKDVELKGRAVAVVSPGADGECGTGDDIRTW